MFLLGLLGNFSFVDEATFVVSAPRRAPSKHGVKDGPLEVMQVLTLWDIAVRKFGLKNSQNPWWSTIYSYLPFGK